jgi:glutaryl-CoA dehydrogenase
MENARQFAQTNLMPRVIEDFRGQTDDKSIIKLMGENGFLGCTLSEY